MATYTAALGALYAALLAARAVLAWRHAREQRSGASQTAVTILQPILSGDPRLENVLAANLNAHPDKQFLWLIDDDDTIALDIAHRLARPNLRIVRMPGPRDGENPKLAKLARALPLVNTPRVMVLDDDTVLPAGASLPYGDLATGLPIFDARDSVWERLTGGFVNGNAVLTYLPAARLGLQRTINGMIYSSDTALLRTLGGFEAAGHELTDDYAVARLFLRSGRRILQTTQPALVTMTIASFGHYARVMRRWMIFASHYFRGNFSIGTLFWVGLPSLLPLAGMAAALSEGMAPAWLGLLLGKAMANRLLLWRITGIRSRASEIPFEIGADLLTPLWALSAMILPGRLAWRSRRIHMVDGVIRYNRES